MNSMNAKELLKKDKELRQSGDYTYRDAYQFLIRYNGMQMKNNALDLYNYCIENNLIDKEIKFEDFYKPFDLNEVLSKY